jgi:PEGA domain-containing protein
MIGPPPIQPSRQLLLDDDDLRRSPVRTMLTVFGLLVALGGGVATWFLAPLAVGALSPAPRDSAPSAPAVAVPAPPPPVVSPAPAPRPAVHKAPRPRPPAPPEPAVLDLNAVPWGVVSLDGRVLGNTPILHLAVPAGVHRVMVQRDGFEPFVQTIYMSPGERVRLTDITLRPSPG